MPKDEDKKKILSKNLFPVVGIGASAGGLDAFKGLIRAIPENSGMAYIFVQHLHPDHESSLPAILQRETNIPVQQITDNVHVLPDNIYIIPSNKLLVATDGILQLSPRPPKHEKNMPIDVFLTSLSEVHQSHAIGVILSGTGMDGTLGLKNIKDQGGVTFAQDPETAAYDGMPVSAINSEIVDFILSPEMIPGQLLTLNKVYTIDPGTEPVSENSTNEATYKKILALVRTRKNVDFTFYKQTTIRRRILRRMVINKVDSLTEYFEQINENKVEQDILFQDMLIPVTSFFRDEKSFEALCQHVLPEILKEKSLNNPLRIWIAGCSTGEEAYSIGICLNELLNEQFSHIKIQIFATDLSETAINKARSGIYLKKELQGVSESRLEHFFVKIDGNYQVKKYIRDMFVFAIHNFLKDPPFARLDLVTCRNVLIYFENYLQKKAFIAFHYALNDKGFLMLGKSESPGIASDLFVPLTKTDKLYKRKSVPGRFLMVPEQKVSNKQQEEKITGKNTRPDDFQKYADDILLTRFTPPSVIINEQHDIVQFRGSSRDFLEPSAGKATLNIFKMAKESLSFELRNAISKAQKSGEPFIKEGIVINEGKKLTIEVIPLVSSVDLHFMIVFKDIVTETPSVKLSVAQLKALKDKPQSMRILQLENDLAQVRDNMRTITEEQDAANEELQSANEELLSGGEEMQSLNEELETSKEELQSTNEELITINEELYERNDQFNQARLYAEAILTTIHEPLLVLDFDFKIKSANQAFYTKFQSTEEEIFGKEIFQIGNNEWENTTLRNNLEKFRKDKTTFKEWEEDFEFPLIGKKTLCINAQPVKRESGKNLILLAINDITQRKETEEKLKLFAHELEIQVQERTLSLKEANIELEHSNKNLEQFASIASHDLQEPLRKIQVFAGLLNQRHQNDTTPDTKELLNKIVVATERMSTLIKDVLNFSRITNPEVAFKKTNFNNILENVMKDFDLLMHEKKASVRQEDLPVIEAIPIQINQLFYNLVNNSLKFSKQDTPPVINISSTILNSSEISKYPNLHPGISYCEIKFTDNGIGFDQEYADQIFMIFERLHSQTEYSGTGIGLALCKKIVTIHHGEIRAESKLNKGTTFYIILPLKQPVLNAELSKSLKN